MATLYGGLDRPGPYLVLMKRYPGYMSVPHTYATDRLSLVLSGTWWVNSGSWAGRGPLRCLLGRVERHARTGGNDVVTGALASGRYRAPNAWRIFQSNSGGFISFYSPKQVSFGSRC